MPRHIKKAIGRCHDGNDNCIMVAAEAEGKIALHLHNEVWLESSFDSKFIIFFSVDCVENSNYPQGKRGRKCRKFKGDPILYAYSPERLQQ